MGGGRTQGGADCGAGRLELAWAQLREAMGGPGIDSNRPEADPAAPHFPQNTLEAELATAGKKVAADLAALSQEQSAQASAVGAAKSDFGPRVSAYGNWEEDQSSLRLGRQQLVAGVQISVDFLPFGRRAQLSRESAASKRSTRNGRFAAAFAAGSEPGAHSPKDRGTLVGNGAAAMDNRRESLLRILKNRYGAGLATITDLLRAEDAERQSQSNYWHAVYGNAMAYTELYSRLGHLTPDAAEELQ